MSVTSAGPPPRGGADKIGEALVSKIVEHVQEKYDDLLTALSHGGVDTNGLRGDTYKAETGKELGQLALYLIRSTVAPLDGGLTVDEALAREREAELSALRHRREVAKLKAECEQLEQQPAELKTRSRVKRIGLWSGAYISVAGVIHLSAWWIWGLSHPMSNFELVVSTASSAVSVCAGVVIYALSRFGRSKSDSSGADEAVEAAKSLRAPDEQALQ
jgi:hypothetical protein